MVKLASCSYLDQYAMMIQMQYMRYLPSINIVIGLVPAFQVGMLGTLTSSKQTRPRRKSSQPSALTDQPAGFERKVDVSGESCLLQFRQLKPQTVDGGHAWPLYVAQVGLRAWTGRSGFSAELPRGFFQTLEARASCFLEPCYSSLRKASDHADAEQMVQVGEPISRRVPMDLMAGLQGLLRSLLPF